MYAPRLFIITLPALLLTAPVTAQGPAAPASAACAAGPADQEGARVAFTLAGPPELAAELMSMGMQVHGFTTPEPLRGQGAWTSAPYHAWLPDYLATLANGQPHPGVQLSGDIQPRGDSTEITLVARTLCSLGSAAPAGPLGSTEDLVEQLSAYLLMAPMAGFAADDGRGGTFSLDLPPALGDLRRTGQRSVPPRSVMLHYAGADSLAADVYFYLGPVPSMRCTPSCAELEVRREVSGYLRTIPGSPIYAGASAIEFQGMETLSPDPGSGWKAGSHLAHHIVREEGTIATHYYVFAFPDYLMKIRSTFPASPARTERLRAFVDGALGAIIRTEGGPPPPALPRSR